MTYATHAISIVATANLRFLCCCLDFSTQLGISTYSFNFQPASSGALFKMRSFLSFLLLGIWGACVHALSSSGSRLLVVLEEDKSLYSNLWADLEGIINTSVILIPMLRLWKYELHTNLCFDRPRIRHYIRVSQERAVVFICTWGKSIRPPYSSPVKIEGSVTKYIERRQ